MGNGGVSAKRYNFCIASGVKFYFDIGTMDVVGSRVQTRVRNDLPGRSGKTDPIRIKVTECKALKSQT